MASRLVTVRLSPEDERLAQRLQDHSINVSELVRRAIREAAARLQQPIDPDTLKAELLRLHPEPDPDPTSVATRTPRPHTTDRTAVQAFIREQIQKRGGR